MAKRKTLWQVVQNDSVNRTLRTAVATFRSLKEAREFYEGNGSPTEWAIRTKPDLRSDKQVEEEM